MKTRNKMLLVVCVLVSIYAAINVIMGFTMEYQLDSTLTTEIFSFAKWVVVTGGAITCAKTVKGQTNSDETEDDDYLQSEEDIENDSDIEGENDKP